MIANDQTELLGEIGFEKVGTRHRRRVVARGRHVPIGQTGVDLRIGRCRDSDFGVEGAKPALGLAALGKLVERIAQKGGVAVVELPQRRDRLTSIGEAAPGKWLGAGDGFDGLRIDSLFHDPL